jgi:hypothetical protein
MSIKERHMMEVIKQSNRGGAQDLIEFTKQRRVREAEEEQYKVQEQRRQLFDKFTRFVMQICLANLVEVQYENKKNFG